MVDAVLVAVATVAAVMVNKGGVQATVADVAVAAMVVPSVADAAVAAMVASKVVRGKVRARLGGRVVPSVAGVAVVPMDDMGIHQRFVDRSHGKYCCYPRSNGTCGTAHA